MTPQPLAAPASPPVPPLPPSPVARPAPGPALGAAGIAWTRHEATRRRWFLLLAAVWAAYAGANFLFHLTGGLPGPAWAALLTGPWPWVLAGLGGLALVGLIRPFSPPVFLAL